jgi:cytoskeletal protein CcmA (bactofilin family)
VFLKRKHAAAPRREPGNTDRPHERPDMSDAVTTPENNPPAQPARSLQDIPPDPMPGSAPRQNTEPRPQRSVGARMTVGPGIDLKGEIDNCDTIVVEGNLQATLSGEVLEVAEGGVFKGNAKVAEADIQGRFEGELSVSGILRVRSGGHVNGTVKYGRIEVEAGGEIAGSISRDESAPAASDRPRTGLPTRS